jgi:hypothetical protein
VHEAGELAALRLARSCAGGAPLLPADAADADALATAAIGHGLAAWCLAVAGDWPGPAVERLAQAARDTRLRTGLQLDRAAAIRDRLTFAGLPTLPLKGTALVPRVYADPALRPMLDLDLFVCGDVTAAARVLVEDGFTPRAPAAHALVLASPEGFELELHHALAAPARFHRADGAAWIARGQPDAAGRPAAASADLLVQLAVHAAFQHGLVLRLGQWLDFRALLEREPPPLAAALAAAREARATAELYAALQAATDLVGAAATPLLAALAPLVPRAVRRHLAWRQADPASLCVPREPPLARVRLALAAGRRLELLRATLRPPGLPLARVPARFAALVARGLGRQH